MAKLCEEILLSLHQEAKGLIELQLFESAEFVCSFLCPALSTPIVRFTPEFIAECYIMHGDSLFGVGLLREAIVRTPHMQQGTQNVCIYMQTNVYQLI